MPAAAWPVNAGGGTILGRRGSSPDHVNGWRDNVGVISSHPGHKWLHPHDVGLAMAVQEDHGIPYNPVNVCTYVSARASICVHVCMCAYVCVCARVGCMGKSGF